MEEVDVACGTFSSADNGAMHAVCSGFYLLDEVGQGTEPQTIIPLSHAAPGARVVMIGDHKQLPPTVLSGEATFNDLQTSLFQRLCETPGFKRCMLEVQYRMHPTIARWPSYALYDGMLSNGDVTLRLSPPGGFPWPKDCAIAFVHVEGREQTEGTSFENPHQVSAVCHICKLFRDAGYAPRDIAVMTWYDGQRKALRRTLSRDWTVASVDSYQGQERNITILSTVRSNAKSQIGFVDDPRRLNVAVTRARRGCVIVGDYETLQIGDQDGAWNSLLQYLGPHALQFTSRLHPYTPSLRARGGRSANEDGIVEVKRPPARTLPTKRVCDLTGYVPTARDAADYKETLAKTWRASDRLVQLRAFEVGYTHVLSLPAKTLP